MEKLTVFTTFNKTRNSNKKINSPHYTQQKQKFNKKINSFY